MCASNRGQEFKSPRAYHFILIHLAASFAPVFLPSRTVLRTVEIWMWPGRCTLALPIDVLSHASLSHILSSSS